MTIAICNSNKDILDWISELAEDKTKEDESGVSIYQFSTEEKLMSALETQRFDIVFMKEPLDTDSKTGKSEYFDFQMHYRTTKVKLSEITYFESNGRKIRIALRNKEFLEFYGKLDDVENRIKTEIGCIYFIRKHKSFLVNENYIYKIERNALTLKDGKRIPISRTYQ